MIASEFQPMCGTFRFAWHRLHATNDAADPVQARRFTKLESSRRHELHADANAQEWLSALADLLFQTGVHIRDGIKASAAIAECAYARQYDPISTAQRHPDQRSP